MLMLRLIRNASALSGCPRLILYNALTTSTAQPITRPTLFRCHRKVIGGRLFGGVRRSFLPVGFADFGRPEVQNPSLVCTNRTIRVEMDSLPRKCTESHSLRKSHHTSSAQRPVDISIRPERLNLTTPKESHVSKAT